MMTIGSAANANNRMQAGGFGMNMQTDSVSRNIQNQIANAQKKLQELSSNEELTLEEKMKKRQEIQQQITDLNQQLRQHEIEQRKEKQEKGSSMDDMLGTDRKANSSRAGAKGSGFSQAGMRAMISADSSMKQAQAQGGTITQMEGRARVLESEIKMDKSRGASTEKKEEELADLKAQTVEAAASQMSMLADANKAVEEAAAADREAEADAASSEAEKATDASKAEKTEDKKDNEEIETVENSSAESEAVETESGGANAGASGKAALLADYTPVDIRL